MDHSVSLPEDCAWTRPEQSPRTNTAAAFESGNPSGAAKQPEEIPNNKDPLGTRTPLTTPINLINEPDKLLLQKFVSCRFAKKYSRSCANNYHRHKIQKHCCLHLFEPAGLPGGDSESTRGLPPKQYDRKENGYFFGHRRRRMKKGRANARPSDDHAGLLG
jgi:hypothetical protein